MAIFTVEEAQAFPYQGQTPLAGVDVALIAEAAARIAEAFRDICGVAFAPTPATRTLNGSYDGETRLPDPLITAVSAIETWDGTQWVASVAPYRLVDDGVLLGRWGVGRANVRVTYTHGYADPPAEIKRAALILAVEQLAGSNISARATQQTNENGTFNLAVPGWRDGQYFGLPEVDAVLAREAAKWRGPRVG